jgi:hypothetical protein
MKLAIIGSRDFPDMDLVRYVVSRVCRNTPGLVIVSGGARGVDQVAAATAELHKVTLEVWLPDWSKGRGAGMARNTQIIDNCDRFLAFWDGQSKGTLDSIQKAKARGLRGLIIDPEGKPTPVGTAHDTDTLP